MHHVLATSKTNLEPDRTVAKAVDQIEGATIGVVLAADGTGGQVRQIGFKPDDLGGVQGLAPDTTVEVAPGCAVGVGAMCHSRPSSKPCTGSQRRGVA